MIKAKKDIKKNNKRGGETLARKALIWDGILILIIAFAHMMNGNIPLASLV